MYRHAIPVGTLTLVVAVMLAAGEARGQVTAGGGLQVGVPRGEFDIYVDPSFGLGGFAVFDLGRTDLFGFRVDGSYLIYGSESITRPLSPTIPRVRVDVTTENQIISGFLGPQLTLPLGDVKPFINTGIGISYFYTQSSVAGTDNFEEFASSTNFDDLTFAWTNGGGLWVRLSRRLSLSFSAQFVLNGQARYLREGSIRDNLDGTISYVPIESDTNMWVYQLGLAYSPGGFRR